MRRSSQPAIEISAALAGSEGRVSPRRLEGWDLSGLGADGHLPIEEQVAHYRALAAVAGPGRGRNADLAACRLAVRGFVCRRLRGALLRAFNIAEVGQHEVPLDFTSDESTDAAFERLDEIAQGITASIGEIPLPMRRVLEKLRRNVYDSAARFGETGDVIFHSAIENFMCLLLGGEIYDAQPIAAMFGADASEIGSDEVDFVNQRLRITAWEVDEAYRSVPLAQVVVIAQWLRERAHLAVAFLGLEAATESQLDELAALFAPYALYLLDVVSSRVDDSDEFVAALGLPSGLGVPEPATPPLSS